MLLLVGLGLEAGDISLRAFERLKHADTIMLDMHTNRVTEEQILFLEKGLGKKPIMLERQDLEENVRETIEGAKEKDIAILAMGDPLIATTHHIIIDEAFKLGISVKVFHAPSIFSAAIGASGLDIYRFGPTTTIPFWADRYKPISFIDVIAKNLKNNEHTLILLDYNYKENKAMDLKTALSILSEAEKIKPTIGERKLLILGNVGTESETICYISLAKAGALAEKFEGKLLSIIVPAKPNFAEEESLEKFTVSSI